MIQNFRMLGKRNRERLGKRWQMSVIVWFVALFHFSFCFQVLVWQMHKARKSLKIVKPNLFRQRWRSFDSDLRPLSG